MLFAHHSFAAEIFNGRKISPLKLDDTMTEAAKE
jgi:hypothetical protein